MRLIDLRRHRMSLATRILAWHVFALPLLSYVSKFVLIEGRALAQIRALAMDFFERVRWCPFDVFCHSKTLFKTLVEARDPFIDNVAALIATSWRLEKANGITDQQIAVWEADQRVGESYATLRPLTAFARAYSAFRIITHETVAEKVSARRQHARRGVDNFKIHNCAYAWMHAAETHYVKEVVARRLELRGLRWNQSEVI